MVSNYDCHYCVELMHFFSARANIYFSRCAGYVFSKVGRAAALTLGGGLLMLQVSLG